MKIALLFLFLICLSSTKAQEDGLAQAIINTKNFFSSTEKNTKYLSHCLARAQATDTTGMVLTHIKNISSQLDELRKIYKQSETYILPISAPLDATGCGEPADTYLRVQTLINSNSEICKQLIIKCDNAKQEQSDDGMKLYVRSNLNQAINELINQHKSIPDLLNTLSKELAECE